MPTISPTALDAMAYALTVGHDHMAPILGAALRGDIRLAIALRGINWQKTVLETSRPTLLIVGDDDHQSTGPAAWPGELREYAPAAMIHAAAADVPSYQLALKRCLEERRYVLVETSSTRLLEWGAYFATASRKVLLDIVRPPAGQQHPVPREKMH